MIELEKVSLSRATKEKVGLFENWVDTGLIKQKEFDDYFQEHHIMHFFKREFFDYLIEQSKSYGSVEDYITYLIFEHKKNEKKNNECRNNCDDCVTTCKNKC